MQGLLKDFRSNNKFKRGNGMKRICTIVLCCTFGCPQSDSSNSTGGAEKQGDSSITLEDLVYVDVYSPGCPQIPLVCGTGRDFSTGRELAFRHVRSGETIHAVFPEGISVPEDLDGRFALHGDYQGIQKRREGHLVKRPPNDYRYFVVSSWEERKWRDFSNNCLERTRTSRAAEAPRCAT